MISNLENGIVTRGRKPYERQMPQGNGKIEMKAKHLDLPEPIKAAVVKKAEYPVWMPSVVKKGGYSVQSHPLRPFYI